MKKVIENKQIKNAITIVMALYCVLSPIKTFAENNRKIGYLIGPADTIIYRADSLIVKQLRKKGVRFSHNNSVTLLTTGQEKFDDLFKAIDQAKSSIHLEYFNFRNDSINNELIRHLAAKAKEGVEVRAIFDGFGNAII